MAATFSTSDQDNAREPLHEQTSLLCGIHSESEQQDNIIDNEGKAPALTRRAVDLCALTILLLGVLSASGLFQDLPLNQVLESILCAQLHLDEHVGIQCGESSVVQAQLAMLRGWQTVFNLIPGKFMNEQRQSPLNKASYTDIGGRAMRQAFS